MKKPTKRRHSRKTKSVSDLKNFETPLQMDSQHPHGLLSIIRDHHDEIRPDIEILKSDKASITEKKRALRHFIPFLKAHAHAEAHVLYSACELLKPLKMMAAEGDIEHATAERLMRELETEGFEAHWNDQIGAKAKVLVEMVEHHIKEEENEFFEKIRGSFTREELVAMADAYLIAFKAELAAREFFGIRIPGMDEVKDTVNKSWKEVYGRVSEKMSDYVTSVGQRL